MNAISFVTDFLTNRTQRVCVNGTKSNKLNVKQGVPQGTVHGLRLFLLYVNDLTNYCNPNTEMDQYADDKMIFAADKNRSASSEPIESQSECICFYFE